jgi:putative spermidine/putrescine transport system permease protein
MRNKGSFIASFVPLIVLMAVGYVVPVASNIIGSLQDKQGGFVGFENWATVLTSYYFVDSLLFTLKVAIISTALAMVIAVVCALALRRTFVGKKLVVLMMLLLLLSQTGLISQIAHYFGITQGTADFPYLIQDQAGVGLIIAFTWKFFPYIGMSVLGILQGASQEYEDQAAVLGVGRFRRFWHVTLPMIVPATSIASIIVFAAAFGDYEIPMVLGSSSHRVLSIYTYLKYSDPAMMNRPESYVLMVAMIIVLMVVILVYRHLTMPKEGK